MNSKNLRTLLFEFLTDYKKNSESYKPLEDREILLMDRNYMKLNAKIEKYDKGIKQSGGSYTNHARTNHIWLNFTDYLNRIGKQKPIISNIISRLEIDYPKRDIHREFSQFLNKILIHENGRTLTAKKIAFLTNSFLDDVSGKLPNWQIKLHIDGIWLDNFRRKLDNNTLIRRPKDFDISYEINEYSLESPRSVRKSFISSVIELKLDRLSSDLVEAHIKKFETFLRLFKLGEVFIIDKEISTNSIIHAVQGKIVETQRSTSNISYIIKTSEVKQFQVSRKLILDFLPNGNWRTKKSVLNPIYLAIDRYNEAIKDRGGPESKITKAITCLEALLLGEDTGELNHKLSQRTAFILGSYGCDPIAVFRTMKQAYSVRSRYVHGALIKDSIKAGIGEIIENVLEYARICTVFFIEISVKFNKQQVISEIDDALISPNSYRNLNKKLKEIIVLK